MTGHLPRLCLVPENTVHNFFERQEAARRKTVILVLLFGLATGVIVAIVHFCTVLLLLFTPAYAMRTEPFVRILLAPEILAKTLPVTFAIILLGSLYKFIQLRWGGSSIAKMLGGRVIAPDTNDYDEKRLLNVIEEMAIASGVPVPLACIMEQETGINAFAAGFRAEDAVVGVTRGALTILRREELQGVIAHEFSHILNGDMLLNIRLIGLLHGILFVHLLGKSILRHIENEVSVKNAPNMGVALFFGSALYLLGFAGGVLGTLIKSAISREREYLSDASAVQFTRNPAGLAGALKKIGGLHAGSLVRHFRAPEASHMYFGNGREESIFAIFSTHPPLQKRILLLDPAFDGHFPKVKCLDEEIPIAVLEPRIVYPPEAAGEMAAAATVAAAAGAEGNKEKPVALAPPATASPMQDHMTLIRNILKELPEAVRQACRNPGGAQAVIYSLLFDREDDAVRMRQWRLLWEKADPEVVAATEKLAISVSPLPLSARLPLLDLATPALRALDAGQYRRFKALVAGFVEADNRVNLFEYVLRYVLIRRLDHVFGGKIMPAMRINALQKVGPECSCVLSLLARLGHDTKQEARAAFEAAAQRLNSRRASVVQFLKQEECTLSRFNVALHRLDSASLAIKRTLLAACLDCLTHDGRIQDVEAALFRVIASGLDCPVPVWLLAAGDPGIQA